MHMAKFSVIHLLLKLLTLIVTLLVHLLFAKGRTWRRGGADDDIT